MIRHIKILLLIAMVPFVFAGAYYDPITGRVQSTPPGMATDSEIAALLAGANTWGDTQTVPKIISTGDVEGVKFVGQDTYEYPSLNDGDTVFIWRGEWWARVDTTAKNWQGDTVQTIAYDYNVPYEDEYVEDGTFSTATTEDWSAPFYTLTTGSVVTFDTYEGRKSVKFVRDAAASVLRGLSINALTNELPTTADRTYIVSGWIYAGATGQATTGANSIAGMGLFMEGFADGAMVGANYTAGAATYYSLNTLGSGTSNDWVSTASDIPLGQWVYVVMTLQNTTCSATIYSATDSDTISATGGAAIDDVDGWDERHAGVIGRSGIGMDATGSTTFAISRIQAHYED